MQGLGVARFSGKPAPRSRAMLIRPLGVGRGTLKLCLGVLCYSDQRVARYVHSNTQRKKSKKM